MAVTGVDAQIIEALLWYMGQFVATPAMTLANPSVGFIPQIDTPYLDVTVMPNLAGATGIAFGSQIRRQGLMQVSVFWPSGQGLVKPAQVASQIVSYWKRGTRIDRNGLIIKVNDSPKVASPISEPDWLQVPVTVAWDCISDNT